jgi:hypothetical protein
MIVSVDGCMTDVHIFRLLVFLLFYRVGLYSGGVREQVITWILTYRKVCFYSVLPILASLLMLRF